ncbi:MAG TPA: alpha/beta hydrolase [Gammaproteobacteria bacterium]|nr:alpha/beta hydrolase [Gammaproteobacteria bacterium]
MIRSLGLLAACFWAVTAWAAAEPYGYPFDDPFVATVVGTPEEDRAKFDIHVPTRRDSLTVFEDREVPDFLFYEAKLRYSYALQKKPAPLVFLIAGTGGAYNGGHISAQARAFYAAGFHVVSLSSPTIPNFIVAASRTSVTGHAVHDAEDLYHVMELIQARLLKKTEITDYFVTGYSLGGFNAAFVSLVDEERKVFNFRKVLLINPPVRLYSSISLLDRMLENIPGGVDNFPAYYNGIVTRFGQVYVRAKRLDFSEDFLYQVYEALQPKNEQLAALIGLTFRFASAHMAFASDVMTNYGYVKPKNLFFTRNSDPGVYREVSFRLGFTDYFHDYFYPYYKRQDPSLDRHQVIESMSLTSIEDYLHNADKIEVMHNHNDLILEAGEIDFFTRVFGERAKIYPSGGHLGNMEYRDNVEHMVNVFKNAVRGGQTL